MTRARKLPTMTCQTCTENMQLVEWALMPKGSTLIAPHVFYCEGCATTDMLNRRFK